MEPRDEAGTPAGAAAGQGPAAVDPEAQEGLIYRRNVLLSKLVVGGASHRRSSSERFRYRLDVLLDLHDVELRLEEMRGDVWYMVTCTECDTLPPSVVRFERDAQRVEWVSDHLAKTGHIVIKFEEPR